MCRVLLIGYDFGIDFVIVLFRFGIRWVVVILFVTVFIVVLWCLVSFIGLVFCMVCLVVCLCVVVLWMLLFRFGLMVVGWVWRPIVYWICVWNVICV